MRSSESVDMKQNDSSGSPITFAQIDYRWKLVKLVLSQFDCIEREMQKDCNFTVFIEQECSN